MHHQLSSCLLALLLSATSSFAQFQGVVSMNMTVLTKEGQECGAGTIQLAIAKAGMRGEVHLQLGRGRGMHRVVLCRTDAPNTNYIITDSDRTYTEVDLSPAGGAGNSGQGQVQWTVQKLGRQKILGHKTQHVLAKKTGTGESMEMWIATDFLDFETYRKLQGGGGGSMEGLNQALKQAGAEGMPLKAVLTADSGGKVKLETVKAENKALPASTFEIPNGYTRLAGGGDWP